MGCSRPCSRVRRLTSTRPDTRRIVLLPDGNLRSQSLLERMTYRPRDPAGQLEDLAGPLLVFSPIFFGCGLAITCIAHPR